jgi:hypothetical protein
MIPRPFCLVAGAHGIICGSENNLVVDRSVRDPFVTALRMAGAAILNAAEGHRLARVAFDDRDGRLRRSVLGQAATSIAAAAGVGVPPGTRLLVRLSQEGARARCPRYLRYGRGCRWHGGRSLVLRASWPSDDGCYARRRLRASAARPAPAANAPASGSQGREADCAAGGGGWVGCSRRRAIVSGSRAGSSAARSRYSKR